MNGSSQVTIIHGKRITRECTPIQVYRKVVDRPVDLHCLFLINSSITNSYTFLGVPGSIKKIRLSNNTLVIRHLSYLYAAASNTISVITHTCTSLQHLKALVFRHISMIHIAHEGKAEIQTVACRSAIFLVSSSQFINNANETIIGLEIAFNGMEVDGNGNCLLHAIPHKSTFKV